MAKPVLPPMQQNMLDKVIAYFSPALATKRYVARSQLAMAGGYSGARIDTATMNRYAPRAGSPYTDIIRDLPALRSRSRDQMRNAPVALGAINTLTSGSVGTGLSLTPDIAWEFLGLTEEDAEDWTEDTKFKFETWAKSLDCDLARRANFYAIQKLAFKAILESGDCGVLTPRVTRAGYSAILALQLIEADRICNPDRNFDTPTLIDGIELSETTGETIAVHVTRTHPGDANRKLEWDRIVVRGVQTGRKNFLHLFQQLRPGQVRGVPLIAPIIEPLKQLQRWTDSELNAAVVSALFSVFIEMDPDAFDSIFDDDAKGKIVDKSSSWSGEMESGKAVSLLPGESVKTPTPGRPNINFDPFWCAIVRQIGMTIEVPFEVLVMHFQSSYSAARGASLMAWKTFRGWRDFLTANFCQPVYELWLEDEVAQGRINAPGFFSDPLIKAAWCGSIWTGDGPGSIDPGADVKAARERVDLGISTLQEESILYDGKDWSSKHEQRVREINAQKKDGIYIPPPGSPAQPTQDIPNSPTTPADPEE